MEKLDTIYYCKKIAHSLIVLLCFLMIYFSFESNKNNPQATGYPELKQYFAKSSQYKNTVNVLNKSGKF
jgi:hypothetical protein